jgi:hypothetical protein
MLKTHVPKSKVDKLVEAMRQIELARFNNANKEIGDLLLYKSEVASEALKEFESK